MGSEAKGREASAGTDRLLAQALNHSLRARIAARPENLVASPQDLARELDEPLPIVAYHHGVLRTVGLIEKSADLPS